MSNLASPALQVLTIAIIRAQTILDSIVRQSVSIRGNGPERESRGDSCGLAVAISSIKSRQQAATCLPRFGVWMTMVQPTCSSKSPSMVERLQIEID